MSHEGRQFLIESGAEGPLHIEWTHLETAETGSRQIEQAAFVIGRDPSADLVLDDPSIHPFHAFFQVVDGRLFVFDLETPEGIRWGAIPRAAGWFKRGEPLAIGRYVIRLIAGDCESAESLVEPAPTTLRYTSRRKLPPILIEFRLAAEGRRGRAKLEVLDRVLVVGGASERCKLRFDHDGETKFLTTLLRTPAGLWVANIVPGIGARVNGANVRFARIEDEDFIELGPLSIRVNYSEPPATTVHPSEAIQPSRSVPPIQPQARPELLPPTVELSPEVLLESMIERAGRDPGGSSSPFGQALVMLVQLLGDVHRDHLSLVREELAEIRRLSREMDQMRLELQKPAPAAPQSLPQASPPAIEAVPGSVDEVENHETVPEPPPRLDHVIAKEIVGERLRAWERERQGRLRKLLSLLEKS